MSHVETARVTITDLDALKAACARLGVEFVENKKTYNWYGRHMGDYPPPAGFNPSDLGHCDHVVRVPGVNYEIGIVKARNPDGTPAKGYTCLFDFWGTGGSSRHDGQKLLKQFGQGLVKLVDAYSVEALKAVPRKKGYTTSESKLPNGKTKLLVTGFA
jgi:hypothetical protein